MKHATPEIKDLAVRLYHSDKYSMSQVAEITGYSISSIKNWIKADSLGQLHTIKKRGCRPPGLNDDDLVRLKQIISDNNHITIRELVEIFDNKCQKSAMHRAIQKLNLTYKKNSTGR